MHMKDMNGLNVKSVRVKMGRPPPRSGGFQFGCPVEYQSAPNNKTRPEIEIERASEPKGSKNEPVEASELFSDPGKNGSSLFGEDFLLLVGQPPKKGGKRKRVALNN